MKSVLCITILSLTLAACADSFPAQPEVRAYADLGGNATLPCRLPYEDSGLFGAVGIRVKWTKVVDDEEEDVLLSMGFHRKTYGSFADRVYLQERDNVDASLVITDVTVEDVGKYRCEIINGMSDAVQEVILEMPGVFTFTQVFHSGLSGVVFPYSPELGRYVLNFESGVKACEDQDAVMANPDQLIDAWRSGLDWCNAGWLDDGTVRYPIIKPREPCGGANNSPGLRNYGLQNKLSLFDVFCFASELKGHFYWLEQPERLTFAEAVQACLDDEAEIAKVGHIFAAWKLEGFDRCDAGWLADGSVRYPISRPRKNCSPTEAAVRFVGFPDKMQKSYGVYCFKAQ